MLYFFLFSAIDLIHCKHCNKDISRNDMNDHQVSINSFISSLYAYFFLPKILCRRKRNIDDIQRAE